tara:strand:+ start:124 stop:624 length:501 start_codon:yes stop_codon:yes gene_type:complete
MGENILRLISNDNLTINDELDGMQEENRISMRQGKDEYPDERSSLKGGTIRYIEYHRDNLFLREEDVNWNEIYYVSVTCKVLRDMNVRSKIQSLIINNRHEKFFIHHIQDNDYWNFFDFYNNLKNPNNKLLFLQYVSLTKHYTMLLKMKTESKLYSRIEIVRDWEE